MEPLMVVRAIGWGSMGFTVASVVAPRALGRAMGLGDRRALVRVLGARDFVVGAGLAVAGDPTPWLRARLACEVCDAVLHGVGALNGTFHRKRALTIAAGAVALGALEYALLRESANP
ncbi:MAG: hypothetical protein AVDCRST_MAG89-3111 [uncultured Gemmatimonadetes bacterium]|uniref:DUF4267 domain-containing protein n=1 Tax=uncultured Gemmatimonadota bacterium TaxID=203437 RepID=A0A6J4M5U1_9BACT|nr:MAG: hypothetical protein AVDCRST_MAG89-3111 [uncultured Gemmatimonadota bacterium]